MEERTVQRPAPWPGFPRSLYLLCLLICLVAAGGVILFSPRLAAQEVTVTPDLRATLEARLTAQAQTATPTATPTPTFTPTPTPTPTPNPDQLLDLRVEAILAEMSPADRVGQLFVVEFPGDRVAPGDMAYELVREIRVGGVVLSPAHGNIRNDRPDTPRQVARLVNQLQALAYGIYLPYDQALDPRPEDLRPVRSPDLDLPAVNLPLLIGVEQAGDGIPATALRNGFTALPPQMALGATWDAELAQAVGAIVGQELSGVGINLLLGPNLDVVTEPRPDLGGGLGVHVFGGDPDWVGKLGRAYVAGVHQGGSGRVATVARHFPGQGDADRRPDEEVATIQKSLDELRRVELKPFIQVTRHGSSLLRLENGDLGATDLLMSSHVRYSSFQGSRERTPPISLATELRTILEQAEFAPWRAAGGLVMSDALGVPAVRRYYDPALQQFPRRRIALDALLAGNDLLYLARFSLSGEWPETLADIRETVGFFRDRYTTDPDFAARVDASVRRILRLKLRLYGQDFRTPASGSPVALDQVLVSAAQIDEVFGPQALEARRALVGQVAREAITLLYPDPGNSPEALPVAPEADDRLVIFTDDRILQECAGCPPRPALAQDALARAMLALYGPDATGQLSPSQIESFSFSELNALLKGAATPDAAGLERSIQEADWLIFAMLDVDVARYENSDAVKQFLRLRSDRLRGKRLVVISFNAPYYLDATEIGKLTAYLGLYSKIEPFITTSARALFRAIPAQGAPPVAVPGTRFANLIERLEPDPLRPIPLRLYHQGQPVVTEESAAASQGPITIDLTIGSTIEVVAGPILDRNGHPVPDGTPVLFQLIYEGEELALPLDPIPTTDGVARLAVPLDREGTLRITASSVQATSSTTIRVILRGGEEGAQVEVEEPTPTPTPVPPATPTPAPAASTPLAEPVPPPAHPRVDLVTLILAGLTQLVALALFLVMPVRFLSRRVLVGRLLWAMLMGWVAYILYGLGAIPGATWLQANLYPWGVVPVVFTGMLLPLVWFQVRQL